MKKILLVGWGFPPDIDGGLDVHVHQLFRNLQAAEEVEVDLALPEDRAPDEKGIIPVETGDGDMRWKARKMSSQVADVSEDYDVIHTHDWFGAEAGFKAEKYSNTSWVSTIHSLASDRSHSKESEELEEVAVNEPEILLTVSEKLGEKVEKEYGRRPEVIYNGFSRAESSGKDIREDLGIQGDMVFFVGRHAQQKGIEHLIYGFKKYLDDGNKADLVIGGDGHMTGSLKDFTGMLGLESSVHFTGFIADRELGDYYEAADLFVSPSISEPFGLTITEALQAGTPVAATKNGVEEILSPGQIISIEPDSESIKEGIRKGLRIGETEVKDFRTWKDMTEEVLKVYDRII
ncbi:MAG: glycosyltransferase family 4 protein [Candidatus Nanosalina sp.]